MSFTRFGVKNDTYSFPPGSPIMKHWRTWTCFDGDTKRDLAADVRSYYIGDFSNWKDHDAFEASFARLLNDLKANDAVLPKREAKDT